MNDKIVNSLRGVAQPGSAPRWGCGGRGFESRRPDHERNINYVNKMTNDKINSILHHYEAENPGVKTNLARILRHGKLDNTGKLLIYAVDQGFEHGPARSFAINPDAYDPHYHFDLSVKAGLSAFAAPIGLLESGAATFAGQIPTILKINSSNSLVRSATNALDSDQAITSSVHDALRLGCSAIGITIYPGSDNTFAMFEQLQSIAQEAKLHGLAVVVWSYPRGNMSSAGETAVDVVGYSAHMACLLGANIVKIKIPNENIEHAEAKKEYSNNNINVFTLTERLIHIKQCCFNGKRICIFSGGGKKSDEEMLEEVQAIADSDCNGSIIGRNIFRRPRKEAIDLINNIVKIYKNT